MSNEEGEFDPNAEEIALFTDVALGQDLERDFRSNGPFKALIEKCREQARDALVAFSTTDPTDTAAIIILQSEINMFRNLVKIAGDILFTAENAETMLNDMHGRSLAEVTGQDENPVDA